MSALAVSFPSSEMNYDAREGKTPLGPFGAMRLIQTWRRRRAKQKTALEASTSEPLRALVALQAVRWWLQEDRSSARSSSNPNPRSRRGRQGQRAELKVG
jgi:hypothetical protein